MQYSVTNLRGTNSDSAVLAVYVEQVSRVSLNYTFLPPNATNAAAAQAYAQALLTNTTLFTNVVINTQLAAFNISPAYQPFTSPPSLQRVINTTHLSMTAVQQATGNTLAWVIAIAFDVMLVRAPAGRVHDTDKTRQLCYAMLCWSGDGQVLCLAYASIASLVTSQSMYASLCLPFRFPICCRAPSSLRSYLSQ
jgi:hypothetical protein